MESREEKRETHQNRIGEGYLGGEGTNYKNTGRAVASRERKQGNVAGGPSGRGNVGRLIPEVQ